MIINLQTPDPDNGEQRFIDTSLVDIQINKANSIIGLTLFVEGDETGQKHKKILIAKNTGVARRDPQTGDIVYQHLVTEGSKWVWSGSSMQLQGERQKDEEGQLIENPLWASSIGEFDYVYGAIVGNQVDLENTLLPAIVLGLEPTGRYDIKNGR